MSFEEAYTRKNLLRSQVEETKFNNMVRELMLCKKINRAQAERIVRNIIRERRANALIVEDYIGEQRRAEEEKRRAGIRWAQKRKVEIEKQIREIEEREKVRGSIKQLRQRSLEEKYKKQLIEQALAEIPRQKDIIGRELENFEGRINRFLEPLKYGMLMAQKLTGKPERMIRAEKQGILVSMSNWAKKRWAYMSPDQRAKFNTLVGRISR